MTDRSTTVSVLADLATRINEAHDAAEISMSEGVSHALDAGRLLIGARAAFSHGRWSPWLKANVSFAERTAQAYMRMAKRVASLDPAKAQRVAGLIFREALAAGAETKDRPARQALPDMPSEGTVWLHKMLAIWYRMPESQRLLFLREVKDTDPDLVEQPERDRRDNDEIDRRNPVGVVA